MPKLNAAWQIIAPKIDPEYFLNLKNKMLTKNIHNTQMIAGIVYNSHLLLIKTNPKCEI